MTLATNFNLFAATPWLLITLLSLCSPTGLIAGDDAQPLATLVDPDCYHGASYGSYNRKVVAVGSRIFLPYRVSESEAGTFKLVTSADGGKKWSLVYTDDQPSYQCPSMVADDRGRLFLTVTYLGKARLLRFSPDESGAYRRDFVREFCTAGPKTVLVYDSTRQRLYYSHRFGGTLAVAVLDLDGKLLAKPLLLNRTGTFPPTGDEPSEDAHYQSMAVDRQGVLHLIYTPTTYRNETGGKVSHRYAGVFYLRSRDGGENWQDAAGKAIATPAAMRTGTQIHLPAQEQGATIWGESLTAHDGIVHILYWGLDPKSDTLRPHYVRLDDQGQHLARSLPPVVKLHSALTLDAKSGAVYVCGTDNQQAPTLARASDDGLSWQVVSKIPELGLTLPYAQTACPPVTADGEVLMALTDVITSTDDRPPTRKGMLWFCRFPTEPRKGTETR